MSAPTHPVFVYGTLLSGQPNNHWLTSRGARLVGGAVTDRGWRLVDLGAFPAMIDGPDSERVVGELWDVDAETLLALDRLEGVPRLYLRNTVEVSADHAGLLGRRFAHAYTMRSKLVGDCPEIAGGDWLVHLSRLRDEAEAWLDDPFDATVGDEEALP